MESNRHTDASLGKIVTVSVCMTVFNRAALTERCIRGLVDQEGSGTAFELDATVVDDGSTDQTRETLQSLFPDFVTVVATAGNLYWARGMALAHEAAVIASPDYLLWLNDDVAPHRSMIGSLLQASRSNPGAIIVGATEFDGQVTYTGVRKEGRRPGRLTQIQPDGTLQDVDAFNGNIVLIPRQAYRALGPVDNGFEHAYGDNDYGLRAKRAGIPVLLAPTPLGKCERNSIVGTWLDRSLSRRARSKALIGRKGFPIRSHLRYNLRHAGLLGIPFAAATYGRGLYLIWLTRKPRSR